MVRAMCRVQLKDRKRSTDLMFRLGLSETVDQLAMTNSVRWYGHVWRRALDIDVEGQRKKGWSKRTRKKQVDRENVKDGLRVEDSLC